MQAQLDIDAAAPSQRMASERNYMFTSEIYSISLPIIGS